MHLVTGATGNVGRPLVELLVAAGAPVRALSRDPAKAAAVLPAPVEAVRDGAAGPDAFPLEGVRTVFVNAHAVGGRLAALLRQAVEHGVRDVVLLSTSAALDEANVIGKLHRDMEDLVRDSGLRWTALRPGVFHSNALAWAESVRTGDGTATVRAPYGDARVTPVDERDIAAVAARVLLDGGGGGGDMCGTAGRTPVLSGPEQLSTADQVRILGEVLGRPVRFEEVDPDEWRAGLVAAGAEEWVAEGLAGHYARAAARPVPLSPVVKEITGTSPRPFAEWVAAHTAAFGG